MWFAASSNPKTFLLPGNGRAARARITPVDHTARAGFSRWTVDGVVPMPLDVWRRPKTAETLARSYSVTLRVGTVWRAGRLYRRAIVNSWEIEMSAPTDIVVVGGLRMSRHTCRQALSTYYGVISMKIAEGIKLVTTGERVSSGEASVLQYLGPGDVPTGEYVLETQGRWDSILEAFVFPPVSAGLQKTPAVTTMNNIVVTDATNTKLEVYDLLGQHQFTSEPPGGRVEDEWQAGTGQLDNTYFHLQSVDALCKAGPYDAFVPVTLDLGRTWYQAYVPRNPNIPIPPAVRPPQVGQQYFAQDNRYEPSYIPGDPTPVPPPDNGNQFLRGVSSWVPQFFT